MQHATTFSADRAASNRIYGAARQLSLAQRTQYLRNKVRQIDTEGRSTIKDPEATYRRVFHDFYGEDPADIPTFDLERSAMKCQDEGIDFRLFLEGVLYWFRRRHPEQAFPSYKVRLNDYRRCDYNAYVRLIDRRYGRALPGGVPDGVVARIRSDALSDEIEIASLVLDSQGGECLSRHEAEVAIAPGASWSALVKGTSPVHVAWDWDRAQSEYEAVRAEAAEVLANSIRPGLADWIGLKAEWSWDDMIPYLARLRPVLATPAPLGDIDGLWHYRG